MAYQAIPVRIGGKGNYSIYRSPSDHAIEIGHVVAVVRFSPETGK